MADLIVERRAVPREAPDKPLVAKVKSSLPVRVMDISPRGAQLEVGICLRPNVQCELRVQADDAELSLRATVRRCRAWGFGLNEHDQRVLLYRAGVEFDPIDAGVYAKLRGRVEVAEPPALSGEVVAHVAEQPDAAQASSSARAPQRGGPVKIRIRADHVRKILDGGQ